MSYLVVLRIVILRTLHEDVTWDFHVCPVLLKDDRGLWWGCSMTRIRGCRLDFPPALARKTSDEGNH